MQSTMPQKYSMLSKEIILLQMIDALVMHVYVVIRYHQETQRSCSFSFYE